MYKKILLLITTIVIALPTAVFSSPEKIELSVPFIPEVPDGRWIAPWNNACEETSITMVNQYYLGNTKISIPHSRNLIWPLFVIEDSLFGSNRDSDTKRTVKLIQESKMSFIGEIIDNPTLKEIQKEISEGRPVITVHYGFGLNNPELRFRRTGSSYHMMVLSGYDNEKQEFIVQDSGNPNGIDFRYKYDTILKTLHDFDHVKRKANGMPRAIFTKRQLLAKTEDSHRIYYITGNTKEYISHPDLFTKNNWKWSDVRIVKKDLIEKLDNTPKIISNNTTTTTTTTTATATATATSIAGIPPKEALINPESEMLAKAKNTNPIYLIKNDKKYYIAHPRLIKKYGWKWGNVKIVEKDWLDIIPIGDVIWQ